MFFQPTLGKLTEPVVKPERNALMRLLSLGKRKATLTIDHVGQVVRERKRRKGKK